MNDRSEHSTRPEPCRECGSRAWWNGTRLVSPVRLEGGESVHNEEIVRRRACCSSAKCTVGSWTEYEESDYPHRVFQLDVVFAVVCMALVADKTMTQVAEAFECSRDSVSRWRRWVEALAEPRDLEQLCSRLDSDGMPPPSMTQQGRGEKIILLLERLVELLLSKGVVLPEGGGGLVRLLIDRLVRFGDVIFLTKSSPPLRADLGGLHL